MRRRFLGGGAAAIVAMTAAIASAQCPEFAYDGNEPDDFSHFVDADGDGVCEGEAALVDGVFPNGHYPSCFTEGGVRQIGHGHWEYTHRQRDIFGQGEEKDYVTLPQALEKDLANQDPSLPTTLDSLWQTERFLANEPVRFDRFLRPSANPEGRFWQVDEWIGPSIGGTPIPGLTWMERFFVCGSNGEFGPCTAVGGKPALGGYWSTHAADPLGYQQSCGDGTLANPEPARNPSCGAVFTACEGS